MVFATSSPCLKAVHCFAIRGCQRVRMAAHRSLYQSCCILPVWTSSGCCAWLCSSLKRKGALDWNSSWINGAISSSFSYYCFHKLGKTGYSFLIFFLLISAFILSTLIGRSFFLPTALRKFEKHILQVKRARERILQRSSMENDEN